MQQRYLGPAHGDAGAAGLDAMDGAADAERQGFGQDALLAPRQRLLERIGALGPGTMGVLAVSRRHGELFVPCGDEGGREGLRLLNRGNPPEPHLAHQPILQSLVGPFDAALGLRGERVDEFDAQALADPAELGLAVAAGGVLGVDPENAVPIRIESRRTAMRENMVPERAKIGARRLRGGKAQRRQTPRRIVNEHDQRAARAAPFKPVMRAAVDLDQFAKSRPPLAQLKHPLVTPPLRLP